MSGAYDVRPDPITPCFGSTFGSRGRSDIAIFPFGVRELPSVTSSAHWDGGYRGSAELPAGAHLLPASRQRAPAAPPSPAAAGHRGRRTPGERRQRAGPVMPAGKSHPASRLSHLTQDPSARRSLPATGVHGQSPAGVQWGALFFSPERFVVAGLSRPRRPGGGRLRTVSSQ